MLQAGRSSVRVPDEVNFLNWPNPSSRTTVLRGPEVDSASNKNEYQESSWGVKSGWRVGLTTLTPSVGRMSENVEASTSRNHKGLHGLYRDNFSLLLLLLSFTTFKYTVINYINLFYVELCTIAIHNVVHYYSTVNYNANSWNRFKFVIAPTCFDIYSVMPRGTCLVIQRKLVQGYFLWLRNIMTGQWQIEAKFKNLCHNWLYSLDKEQ
jgi:hypothetical protein